MGACVSIHHDSSFDLDWVIEMAVLKFLTFHDAIPFSVSLHPNPIPDRSHLCWVNTTQERPFS